MFHIAIYDSNVKNIDTLTHSLKSIPQAKDRLRVHAFSRVGDLLEQCQKGARFGLITMEIPDWPHGSLEAARSIRALDKNVPLILVSTSSTLAFEGYELQLYRFYQKPVSPKLFREDVLHLLEQFTHAQEGYFFTFTNWEGSHKVRLENILYFESEDNRIRLVTDTREYIYRNTISALELRFRAHAFYRIHKSFLVNIRWVRDIMGNTIVMENGRVLPLSKSKSHILRYALMKLSDIPL